MNKPVLCFRKEGFFRILMVSDFHSTKNANLPRDYSDKMLEGLDALLDESKPDFVMIGGDQCITANDIQSAEAEMRRLIAPIIERKLPWSAVFGNHDNEMGIPCTEEEKAYVNIEGCLNQINNEGIEGAGNYVIPVMNCEGNEIAFNIFALDSHRELTDLVPKFGLKEGTRILMPRHFNDGQTGSMPDFEQVMWYYAKSKEAEAKAGHKIPAVMFMHIPIPEYLTILRNPELCDAVGNKRETVGCTEINSGLFYACLQRGDVKGIFFGHEHLCDIQGEYMGITMAQDAALGYNMSAHDDLRGGRVIDLFCDGTVQTHTLKLIDLLGKKAMRREDYFEGGCKYFIRDL